MKRHVLETCMFVKGYLPGYIYRTLILICTHPTSILLFNIWLQLLSYDACLCLRSILNISAAYTTFGHYNCTTEIQETNVGKSERQKDFLYVDNYLWYSYVFINFLVFFFYLSSSSNYQNHNTKIKDIRCRLTAREKPLSRGKPSQHLFRS